MGQMSKISRFPLFFSKNKFIDESPFALLSDEIILQIFTYLSGSQISSCALVSHRWKNLTRDYSIITNLIPFHIKNEDFHVIYQNLDNKALLKEYLHLGQFLTKCTLSQIKQSTHHNFNDYKHKGYTFCHEYGDYKFFTQRGVKILIKKNDEIYNTINLDVKITSMVILKEMLFSFNENGIIHQWNYITGELIQALNTQKNDTIFSTTYGGFFCLENNKIFLRKYSYLYSGERTLKIIPYKNPSARELISVPKNFSVYENLTIKDDKLFIFFKNKVYGYKLSNKDTLERFFLRDLTGYFMIRGRSSFVDVIHRDNVVFAVDKLSRIYTIDKVTRKFRRSNDRVKKSRFFIELIQNTFLLYNLSNDCITLRDRKSGKSMVSYQLKHNSEDLLFLMREIQQLNQKKPLGCNIA